MRFDRHGRVLVADEPVDRRDDPERRLVEVVGTPWVRSAESRPRHLCRRRPSRTGRCPSGPHTSRSRRREPGRERRACGCPSCSNGESFSESLLTLGLDLTRRPSPAAVTTAIVSGAKADVVGVAVGWGPSIGEPVACVARLGQCRPDGLALGEGTDHDRGQPWHGRGQDQPGGDEDPCGEREEQDHRRRDEREPSGTARAEQAAPRGPAADLTGLADASRRPRAAASRAAARLRGARACGAAGLRFDRASSFDRLQRMLQHAARLMEPPLHGSRRACAGAPRSRSSGRPSRWCRTTIARSSGSELLERALQEIEHLDQLERRRLAASRVRGGRSGPDSASSTSRRRSLMPHLHPALVDEDPVEPGVEGIEVAQPRQLPPRGQERVLGRVRGGRLAAEDRRGEAVRLGDAAGRDGVERLGLAGAARVG